MSLRVKRVVEEEVKVRAVRDPVVPAVTNQAVRAAQTVGFRAAQAPNHPDQLLAAGTRFV